MKKSRILTFSIATCCLCGGVALVAATSPPTANVSKAVTPPSDDEKRAQLGLPAAPPDWQAEKERAAAEWMAYKLAILEANRGNDGGIAIVGSDACNPGT